MTRQALDWLAQYGITLPPTPYLIEAGVACIFAIAGLVAGWYIGRRFGPRLSEFWKERVGGAEGLGDRMGVILRHGSAALILSFVSALWPWHLLAATGVGLALGAATALVAIEVLRGLSLPRWAAWIVGAVLFVAIFSNAIGGLEVITAAMERIGFAVGSRRFTLMSLVTIILVSTLLFAGVRLANRVIGHSVQRTKGFDPAQKLLVQKLSGIAVLVAAFFIGVDFLDIDLTTFAVFSGGLGLAIGFGLQKTVGNLFAGIILLMDRSIKPGDVIVVGDSFGWVNKIGVRAVSVITRDGKEHLIPNENLMTQEVENWSYSDRNVRVRIPVGVSYNADLKLAQELMLKAAQDSPRVLKTPKPNVWLAGYGESSVDHEILAWINDPEGGVGNVRSDVLNRLWHLFKENGIEIPFPQRDVHVKSWADAAKPGMDRA
ncbi:mechanosensitive ion channel [Stakelama sp. CBK3Z-3]|uniref:Mechanosensitive ion channel n=1 Tax=Stakelama flava TaxID=2860338 RepID=A0ABS6XIJ0_9SPHN|nr:mechanosensitive ion channel domain-containing protein [Stakelama flava]MBW4330024.1 mechanosensitive ion channel [Stakelama flava]